MPKIFDNALTRAQVALEDGLPQHSTVDEFDLTPDLKHITLKVGFVVSHSDSLEYADEIPVHLLFDHERLIEVVNYIIQGALIELADNNDPTKVKWSFVRYTFPSMSEILERLEAIETDAPIFDLYHKAFAKYVAFKTINYTQALPYLMGARNLIAPKTERENAKLSKVVERRVEYMRTLFCDAPLFAEHAIALSAK